MQRSMSGKSKGRKKSRMFGGAAVFLLSFFYFFPASVEAKFGECDPGYFFDPRSGVGCKQTYCNDIPSAHWSYEGRCVCGSSGSETENPLDANKECYLPQSETSCPGCLAKCVHLNEKCPGEFGVTDTPEPEDSKGVYWLVQDAFSKIVSVGADLLEAASGIKIKEKTDSDAFYEGRIIFPDAKQADLRLIHLNLEFNREKGLAFEFNFLEIATPGQGAFIDNWSIGIGLGAVSKDGLSKDVPLTPISPGINFNNIRSWFSEQYDDIRVWWRDNAPWYLGGDEPSPIPGFKRSQ